MAQLSRLDPEAALRLPSQVAADAGVSDRRYREIVAQAPFRALLDEQVRQLLAHAALPILHARIATATIPGRDGHNDAKMLLGAAGVVTEKPVAPTVTVTVVWAAATTAIEIGGARRASREVELPGELQGELLGE